jgi:hypothetical protein
MIKLGRNCELTFDVFCVMSQETSFQKTRRKSDVITGNQNVLYAGLSLESNCASNDLKLYLNLFLMTTLMRSPIENQTLVL